MSYGPHTSHLGSVWVSFEVLPSSDALWFITWETGNHVFTFPVPCFSKHGHGPHPSESAGVMGGREVKSQVEERTNMTSKAKS